MVSLSLLPLQKRLRVAKRHLEFAVFAVAVSVMLYVSLSSVMLEAMGTGSSGGRGGGGGGS